MKTFKAQKRLIIHRDLSESWEEISKFDAYGYVAAPYADMLDSRELAVQFAKGFLAKCIAPSYDVRVICEDNGEVIHHWIVNDKKNIWIDIQDAQCKWISEIISTFSLTEEQFIKAMGVWLQSDGRNMVIIEDEAQYLANTYQMLTKAEIRAEKQVDHEFRLDWEKHRALKSNTP